MRKNTSSSVEGCFGKMYSLFLYFLVPLFLFGQESRKVVLENTVSFSFYSAAVKDSFIIQIALPSSFNKSEKKYSSVYVLDSNKSFGMAKDIVDWLSFGAEIPETVVVGISYKEDWWQKRSRDYTPNQDKQKNWGEWPLAGGADHFITFIEAELNPIIEKRFNLDPSHQTIVGLSFGGLFANYVLFKKPHLFDNYLIVSPALIWNNNFVFGLGEKLNAKISTPKIKVYTSVGSLDEQKILDPWLEMNKFIEKLAPANILWNKHLYERQTHLSVFPLALTDGLKILLNN